MANGPVRIGGVAPGSIAGAEAFQALLRSYPQQVIADCRQALDEGADTMVEAIQAAAPVSDLEGRPGELRESVHKEAGRHDLSVLVVEDAKDEQGRAYPAHVEYGHKTPDGGHVPPVPHFWAAVRANKRKIAARMRKAMRDRAKGLRT